MAIEDFTELELLQGGSTIVFVTISVILGFRIFFKYFSRKQIEYITVGLTLIFRISDAKKIRIVVIKRKNS